MFDKARHGYTEKVHESMHNSCKIIVFTGIISIITIITTWIVATNEFINQIIDNDEVKQFALTISGGLFTGFFVSLLSEVHKYCYLKRETETFAFFQILYLYQALFEMKVNTLGALDYPATAMLESFYDESVRKIQAELSVLQSLEYDTFINGEDSLANIINSFQNEISQHMNILVQAACSLRVAVIKTKISNLEKTGHQGMAKSEDNLVKEALSKIIPILDEELNRADDLATAIDSHCDSRYNWDSFKMSINASCRSIYELGYGNM